MSFDASDVLDFSEKLLASNRRLLPKVEVEIECTPEKQSGQLKNIKWVGLFVWFYTERNGDKDHMIGNEYDPMYMRCRVKTSIALYNQRRLVRSFDGVAYAPHPLLSDNTYDDITQTVIFITGTFIIPNLITLELPISKDSWKQQR